MPQLPTLTIETATGTERATLTGDSAERDAHVTEQGRARFRVDRDDWQSVASDINPRSDRFTIAADGDPAWFGGRFRDTERGGNDLVTVVLDDYERDARDAEPTGGQKTFQNADDSAVVLDALSRVPTLSAGTVNTVASGVSYSFANAEPAKMIRTAAQSGGALVRYNADRTVDFVAQPSAAPTETLSPSAGTLVGDPDVRDDNRNPPTVIIGLGAQSGPNQVRAESVVDPAADREVYRKYTNTDIKNQSRLQTIIDRLASEVANAPQKLDIETEAVGVDLSVGDRVEFVWPEEDIDTTLRVIEYTETVTSRGVRYAPIRVANRWPEKGGRDKAAEDLERFNSGYEGFVDRDNFSLDNQPVTNAINAVDSYFYPDDVIAEVRSDIRIRGRAYRSHVEGAGHSHDVVIGTETSLADDFDITDSDILEDSFNTGSVWPAGDTAAASVTIPSDWSAANVVTELELSESITASNPVPTGAEVNYSYSVSDGTFGGGTPLSELLQFGPQGGAVFGDNTSIIRQTPAPDVSAGEDIYASILNLTGQDIEIFNAIFRVYNIRHKHEVNIGTETSQSAAGFEPGVTEFDLYPSNCDVLVNGTSVGVSLGDGTGEFAETVDISGLLSPGDNEIEITSDTTGRVTGAVRTELFRQGPEDTV
jgi:hypothetical protein